MNALLLYPKFPQTFWSLTEVLKMVPANATYYPLGLMTVAALLPKSWQVKLIDLNVEDVREDDWNWADIVMFSGMTAQKHNMFHLISEARKRKKLTVAGGAHAMLLPQQLIEAGCDFVVCGEAETTINILLDALSGEKRGQIITCKDRPDISTSPVPRFDLVNLDNYLDYLVQTTRGCPFDCEFCDISNLYGNMVRNKTPAQVVEELEQLYQAGARGAVMIADDNFIGNKTKAKEICRAIIEWNRVRSEPFGFNTQVSINLGRDLEMIDLMTAANFGEIFIGIETPNPDILKAHQKYQNATHSLFKSIETIKKNGLSVVGSFIIGFDNEEKGAGKRICEFVEQADIPVAMLNLLTAIPGTKLYKRLEREGRLLENQNNIHSEDEIPNFIPTRPLEEIVEEYIEMWEYLYSTPRFLQRTYRFCLGVRPTRKAMATQDGKKIPESQPKSSPTPISQKILTLKVVALHVWRLGILSPHRVLFWKQYIGMKKRNPSRLMKYLIHCLHGESLIAIRKTIRKKLEQNLDESHRQKRIS